MCCDVTDTLDLPPEVIEALASYRLMHAERAWDWGDERFDMFRSFQYFRLAGMLERYGEMRRRRGTSTSPTWSPSSTGLVLSTARSRADTAVDEQVRRPAP
jgi:hypothetical protein